MGEDAKDRGDNPCYVDDCDDDGGGDDGDESRPECDGINLQCVNSSDFIVGKQTTFNGPVTIINCADGDGDADDKRRTDEIVIRHKVLTVSDVKAFAGKASDVAPRAAKDNFLRLPVFLWVLLGAILTVAAVVVASAGPRQDLVPSVAGGSPSDDIALPYNGTTYVLYGRRSWHALPPLSRIDLPTPVPYVVISHAASRFCYDKQSCMVLVRDIQAGSMNGGTEEPDVKYNFMVGGDGNVYEGRGWRTQNPTSGFASGKNIDINFLGSFQSFDPPTYPQIEAVKALIAYGVDHSYIADDYALVSANATKPTLSPGLQVYNIIKEWPHFDPDPRGRGKRDR